VILILKKMQKNVNGFGLFHRLKESLLEQEEDILQLSLEHL